MATDKTHNEEKSKHCMKLRQLLLESCGIMAKYAKDCRNDYVAHNSSQTSSENTSCCDWYHSAWQYLRVLDCVSSPQWHYEFYKSAFEKVFSEKTNVKILISGTADYSFLYLIISLLANNKKVTVEIDVVDLCPTPLEICKWLKKNLKNSNKNWTVKTIQSNITMYSSEYKYDIICSDAFLTRFSVQESKSILSKWEEILNDGGRVITTVRLRDMTQESKLRLIALSSDINIFCKKVISKYKLLTKEEKNKLNISVEDLRFMAFRYIVRMKSNALGGKAEVENLFKCNGLEIIGGDSDIGSVVGEIRETNYYRIVAQKLIKGSKRGKK